MAATDPKSERPEEEFDGSGSGESPSAADLIRSEDFQAKLEAARARRAEVMAKRGGKEGMQPPNPAQEHSADAIAGNRDAPAEPVAPQPSPTALRAPTGPSAIKVSPSPDRRRFPVSTLLAMVISFLAGGAIVVALSGRNAAIFGPLREFVSAPTSEGPVERPVQPTTAPSRSAASDTAEPEGSDDVSVDQPDPQAASEATALAEPETSPVGASPRVPAQSAVAENKSSSGTPTAESSKIESSDPGPPAKTPLAALQQSPVRLLARNMDQLSRLSSSIRSAGVSDVNSRQVDFAPGQSVVRFYRAADRALAERLADRFEANLQDLTNYSPAPTEVGIEVWLAGS